jgi:hypothetical protein
MFVVVGLLGCGAFLVYRALRDPLRAINQVPAELKQPGVLLGQGLLTREVFSNDRRLSQVQAMSFGPVEPGQPDELCSVSALGALFIDADGAAKRYTQFGMQQIKLLGMKLQAAGSRISRFQIIDLGGAGECSFLARDNAMGSELIGHDGKSVWQLGGLDIRSHPSDMVAGDLHGDGRTEFLASYEIGDKGVVLYDASLNEVWSKPDIRASHVELMDSGNGKKSVVCSQYGVFYILDPQGNLVRKVDTGSHARDFLVLNWPPDSGVQYAVFHNEESLALYDLTGKLIFKCRLPNGNDLFRIRAVTFMVGKVPYLAIVGSTALSEKRSIFCVYGLPEHPLSNQTPHESPLYHEVLAETYESMAKLPPDDSARESILIGGLGQILRYRPASLPSDNPKQPRPATQRPITKN